MNWRHHLVWVLSGRWLAATLVLTALAVAAYGQCRLYRKDASATGEPEIHAKVSCDGQNDILVSCGLGPHTSRYPDTGYFLSGHAVRADNITCEATAGEACLQYDPQSYQCIVPGTLEVEATCIAVPNSSGP